MASGSTALAATAEKPMRARRCAFRIWPVCLEQRHVYWRADRLLAEFQSQLPDAYDVLCRIGDTLATPYAAHVLAEAWPNIRKISIDFGIMEGTPSGYLSSRWTSAGATSGVGARCSRCCQVTSRATSASMATCWG